MPSPHELRGLYRRLLRELPSREPSLLANKSPIHQQIRSAFAVPSSSSAQPSSHSSPPSDSTSSLQAQRIVDTEIAEQLIQYLKAQRIHTTLLERYNPGMNMGEEDRVRMTARRVGMDIPENLRTSGGWKD